MSRTTTLKDYIANGGRIARGGTVRKWDGLMSDLLALKNKEQMHLIPHDHELTAVNKKFQPKVQGIVAQLNRRAAKEGHVAPNVRPWGYRTLISADGKTEYGISLK